MTSHPHRAPARGLGNGPATSMEEVIIDTNTPQPARMYDYLLGGQHNFEVDRAAVARASQAVGGIDRACADVRANRAFLVRAVSYLATEAGIGQFLDVGTGIPNGVDDTHTIARAVAPDARIAYVDNDPIVLANAHQLLHAPTGAAQFMMGDLRQPDAILDRATDTLDLSQPVGLILVAVLHFLTDDDTPDKLVAWLIDRLAVGSHVAITHLTADFAPTEVTRLLEALNQHGRDTFVARTADEVQAMASGLELVDPGLVPVHEWRPDPKSAAPLVEGWVPSFYGVVARKIEQGGGG